MTELLSIFQTLLNSTIEFLPRLIGALILLLIGWLVGYLVGRSVKKALQLYNIDERIGGPKPIFKASSIFPVIFSWAIYLIFIQSAVQVLGIVALVNVVGAIIAFLPGLIGGIIIVIVGYIIGDYIRKQIEASKILYADLVGKGLFFLIIYVSVALALPLVGIDPTLVNNILLIIIASVGVGLAIALGLGLKDTVAELVKTYQKKITEQK